MKYEKWDEVLAPYEHAVEELKVKFKNIRKEFLTKGEYSPIEFVTGRTKKISSIISKANRLEAEDIEKEIGEEVEIVDAPVASRIMIKKKVSDVFDQLEAEKYFDWLYEKTILFQKVFSKYFKEFKE